jgi:c-di-GMP-related signal transduction protein
MTRHCEDTDGEPVAACLVRQPVLDRDQNTFGYEFLFRSDTVDTTRRVDDGADARKMVSAAGHLKGLLEIADGRKCFIQFNRRQLLEHFYQSLPPDSTVVEVFETTTLDAEFIQACHDVRRLGYALALDDYVVEPKLQPLLQHINLLKVGLKTVTDEQHEHIVESSKTYGFEVVAENVQTQDDFTNALRLGYTYYQGSFFCEPQLSNSRPLTSSHLHYLRLLQAINQQEFQIDQIESLISQDVALTVKLLQYLNSPGFGMKHEIRSIRQAVGILGHRPLKKWGVLIAVNELSRDRPAVLMSTSLIRAKFCESIGNLVLGNVGASECFLVGILSLLDAILDQQMEVVLQELDVSPEIRDALLKSGSPMRNLLDLVRALEEGDWRWISALVYQLEIKETAVFAEYRSAVIWTCNAVKELA